MAARNDYSACVDPQGVTQFGTAAATPIVSPPAGYDLVLPFTGSAIALGRAA